MSAGWPCQSLELRIITSGIDKRTSGVTDRFRFRDGPTRRLGVRVVVSGACAQQLHAVLPALYTRSIAMSEPVYRMAPPGEEE